MTAPGGSFLDVLGLEPSIRSVDHNCGVVVHHVTVFVCANNAKVRASLIRRALSMRISMLVH